MFIEKDGLKFFEWGHGAPDSLIFGKEKFEESKSYLQKEKCERIYIGRDYQYSDIDFIENCSWIKKIKIDCIQVKNVDVINKLTNLTGISWADPIKCKIDNSSLESVDIKLKKGSSISMNCNNLKYIAVVGCKEAADFWEQISILKNVKGVAFVQGSMPDCTVIKPMKSLESLSIYMVRNFQSMKGIGSLSGTLKELKIDCGKKVYDYSELAELKKLEKLKITHNGIIKSLDFTKKMPNLKEIWIPFAKIEDRDKSKEPEKSKNLKNMGNSEIQKRTDAALSAIKKAFGTDEGEYSVTLFVNHHLEELDREYWKTYLKNSSPDPADILNMLILKDHWDADYEEEGIDIFDFTLPDKVTDYLLSVSFTKDGEVEEISMES